MSVKRSKLLVGSLRNPLFRYVTGAQIVYNPHISKDAEHFFRRFCEIAKKYDRKKIQEVYTWSSQIIEERDLTKKNYCKVTYLDESFIEFDFTTANWDSFIEEVKWTSKAIGGDRDFAGNDDEFDDEV